MKPPEKIAVLGLDPGRVQFREVLLQSGFRNVNLAEEIAQCEDSDLIVVYGPERDQWIQGVRNHPKTAETSMVVLWALGEDPLSLLSLGADDVVGIHEEGQVLRMRLSLAFHHGEKRRALSEVGRYQTCLHEIRDHMALHGEDPDALREVLLIAGKTFGFERVSMMAHLEGSHSAYVVAATDNPGNAEFEVAIEDYPEIREAIAKGQPLFIEDVHTHPVTKGISAGLQEKGISALAVFPVTWKGRSLGGLLFRTRTKGAALSENAQEFGMVLAGQFGAQLRDSRLFDRLRDKTRRLTRSTMLAEKRAQAIESLHEYLDASTNGTVVTDQQGKIIYINRSAETMTGFSRDALVETSVYDLVEAQYAQPVEQVLDMVFEGQLPTPVDVLVKSTEGSPITVQLSSSTVLTKHGAAVLSFHDVTMQRQLEAQLQSSSEFLTNLINSAVDAIIAVDLRGEVILFNRGAETLFGYSASDVVGKMSVVELYPVGVPQKVMRMLRSPKHGGVGRLEQIRREVKVKSGECVPVNMTASIIYEGEREVATVGIFSDLRDRIRIEQRLLQTQEKLKEQEKRSMLAQLAGAAAHELNQPLTSIIGYAQLIQRTSKADDKHRRYTDIIVNEGERMAEIVKKIGRITHYETVPYVGSANIVDIDKSVVMSESAPIEGIIVPEQITDEVTGSIDTDVDSYRDEQTQDTPFDEEDEEVTALVVPPGYQEQDS